MALSKEDLIEGIRRDFRPEPKYPKVGDIVGDVDGDIGLVSDIYYSETEKQFLFRAKWSSGATFTDSWHAEDFEDEEDLYHIVSRA